VPAVGFSLGLERVLLVMEERQMFPPLGIGPQVLLCRMGDVPASAALSVAGELRDAGVRVEVYADPAPMKKQLSYANSLEVAFAAILGPQEVADGTVSLKDLRTGQQESCMISEAARKVQD